MKRRTFLKRSTLASLGVSVLPSWVPNGGGADPPVRALTSPPNYHWFGYYDKEQVDPTGRYALGMEVDFRFRSPRPTDVIDIGVIDLQQGNEWRTVGESTSWGWQQGCMLQWIPGSEEEIIWNDREGGRFVSHVLNVETGEKRTLPRPIYALSQDGEYAVGTDFRRIQNMRPGYGYPGLEDPNRNVNAPSDVGIYRMDLQSGDHELIVPLSEVAKTPHQGERAVASGSTVPHRSLTTSSIRTPVIPLDSRPDSPLCRTPTPWSTRCAKNSLDSGSKN